MRQCKTGKNGRSGGEANQGRGELIIGLVTTSIDFFLGVGSPERVSCSCVAIHSLVKNLLNRCENEEENQEIS